MNLPYQSHDGQKSVSDSFRKLARLELPADLTGKRVLDIGCNEGFFCGEAVRRGAAQVVGIDTNEKGLQVAREKYPDPAITFEKRPWSSLPDGPFDLVLWLSAMHYERDPKAVFGALRRILSPDALVILECGVHPSPRSQMVPVARRNDAPLYPTQSMLDNILDGYVSSRIGGGEHTSGDPIPRYVYHCRPNKPTVLLFSGKPGDGKSTNSAKLAPAADKWISLDYTATFFRHGENTSALAEFTKAHCDTKNLVPFYHLIDAQGFTDQYVSVIDRLIAPTDNLVVIEGYLTAPQRKALTEKLRSKVSLWEATRLR